MSEKMPSEQSMPIDGAKRPNRPDTIPAYAEFHDACAALVKIVIEQSWLGRLATWILDRVSRGNNAGS